MKYGTRATNVLLTCANYTVSVANRAILNRTYNVLSPCGARRAPGRVSSCSKSVAAALRAQIFQDGLALSE